jgi:hypothetical protein
VKYFFDTEFIEDGKTIDLVSIGIVREDDLPLYLQSCEFDISRASVWMWENVFPHLKRCWPEQSLDVEVALHKAETRGECESSDCAWRTRAQIRAEILDLIGRDKPVFWAWYADYDWVALCQLFGAMMDLPASWPKYCRDVKQLADFLSNPTIPKAAYAFGPEHHALQDAKGCKDRYNWLMDYADQVAAQARCAG